MEDKCPHCQGRGVWRLWDQRGECSCFYCGWVDYRAFPQARESANTLAKYLVPSRR